MLREYQEKRNFKKTGEPRGEIAKKAENRFVIQKHQASSLHYDFRLELDGVLKSWAVSKNLPSKVKMKRLAVQTEDHPVDYLEFQGAIPEGNYGAGKVMIWDQGDFDLEKREADEIVFHLHGKKLTGRYALIKLNKQDRKDQNWLIFKTDANLS